MQLVPQSTRRCNEEGSVGCDSVIGITPSEYEPAIFASQMPLCSMASLYYQLQQPYVAIGVPQQPA